jgi:hypothetical protein
MVQVFQSSYSPPLGFLEKDVPCSVQPRNRLAVQHTCKSVARKHIHAVIHDERGRSLDQIEDAQKLRSHAPLRGLRRSTTSTGKPIQVRPFGVVQSEHPRQRIENLIGRLCGAALFETNVVIDADARQVSDLLAPQPVDAAIPVDGNSDRRRIDPGPPNSQKVRQIVHT